MVRVSESARRLVEQRAAHRCEYCRAPQWLNNGRFHIEHFRPRAHGGSDGLDNLCFSCTACNLAKSAAIFGIDPHSGERTPLFNPREYRWEDHFAWAAEGEAVEGKTPIGRATIVRLNMNQPLQLQAPKYWRLLGFL